MGYRHYIYQTDKQLANEIQKCKTKDDFINLIRSKITNNNIIDEDNHIYLPDLYKELHNFGKSYEYADELYKNNTNKLFTSEELQKEFIDFDPIILSEKDFKNILNDIQKRMIYIYEDLLREKSEHPYEKEINQLNRLKEHVDSYLNWWKFGPGDLDKNSENIVSSYLYEHVYFELIRIYKNFDFENNVMIFMGH